MTTTRKKSAPGRMAWTGTVATIASLLLVVPAAAWAQQPQPGSEQAEPPPAPVTPLPAGATQVGPLVIPPGTNPPFASYPLELLGLLSPRPRGPIVLTPSITISEEFNDNLFLDNNNKRWSFETEGSPALTLVINKPTLQLAAGYSFTSTWYARDEQFNNWFDHQNFIVGAFYRATPQLTLTLSDRFVQDHNTNVVSPQGTSSGRQESWSNSLGPGAIWRIGGQTRLSASATYVIQHFSGQGLTDSETYGFQGALDHSFTTRFSAEIGYQFTYLNLQGSENSTTHVPTVGFSYRLTPTLTASVSGGPSFTEVGSQTELSPTVTATLTQAWLWGAGTLQYARGVAVAGGLGGSTDTQTFSGVLALTTLKRGLLLLFSPAYSIAESLSSSQTGQVDVRTLTINLTVAYQLAPYISVFGGYQFLYQRTGGSSTTQADVDQNRVRFGFQFGYPISFD